jgi:phosphoribosylamine--glycine ligase
VTAMGETFEQAMERTYAAIAPIHFDYSYFRRDIGYRVRS